MYPRPSLLLGLVGTLLCTCAHESETPTNATANPPASTGEAPHPESMTVYNSEAQPSTPPKPNLFSNGNLSLHSSLRYGLQENLHIRISKVSRDAAATQVEFEKARFDPIIRAFGGREYQIDGTEYEESEASIEKLFVTGTVISLEGNTSSDSVVDTSISSSFPNGFSSGSPSSEFNSFVEFFSDEEATLRIRQPLLRGASIRANRADVDLAHLNILASDIERRAQTLEFLRGAETGYWTAAVAREISLHEENSLARSRLILDGTRQRVDVGAASSLDLLEAEAGYADAQETAVQARRRYEDALDNLWFILGLPIDSHFKNVRFESIAGYFHPEASPSPEDSYQRALTSFPGVLFLANTIRQDQVRLSVARNNLLPSLDVEVSGRYRPHDQFSDREIVRDYDWGVLLQLTVPWTFRAERAELQRAKFELDRSHITRENAQRVLKRDILTACRAINVGKKQLEIAIQGAVANEKKWDEQQLRFREGLVAVRDLIEDQERTKRAQTRELEARLRLIASWKLLEQLDGSILKRHGFTWN